jgi:hypothetical protein
LTGDRREQIADRLEGKPVQKLRHLQGVAFVYQVVEV